MRKDPARVQRDSPCIDCGIMTRGTRCNACWGISIRGERSPSWKGGLPKKRNAEKERVRARAYYTEHRESILETLRENLSFKSRNASGKRRARAGAVVELVDFTAIYAAQAGMCGICGEFVDAPDVSFDHRVPLASGGNHTADNLQLTHMVCNARKSKHDRGY
jgi:5-methylcytosine-specific restriction endonuclease McrA